MRYAICSPAARSAASTRSICRPWERVPGATAWQALAPFYADYLDILDWQGAVDYSGLVRRTAQLLGNPEVIAEVAGDLRLIVVDEYQDTDPAQELVLRALAATRAQLVVVGDPDQSIYGFRGADVSGILNFAERFRGPRRQRAQVMALGRCRRSGPELVAASRAVAARLPLPGLPVAAIAHHRQVQALGPRAGRASTRRGADLQLSRAGGGRRGRCAAPGPPRRRRAMVVHGGAGPQHPAGRAVAARAGRRGGSGRDPGRRASAHPRAGARAAAGAASVRGGPARAR